MKSVLKRIASLTLALVMMMGLCTVSHAATGHFDDVSPNHWAYENIEKMAEGGLVNGYGNRKFGPQDQFTIAQMAKIICNALGYEDKTNNSYWAYDSLEYCLNGLECLPNFGAITPATYDVPITRELTVYMLVNSLGAKTTGKTYSVASRLSEIPDWREISYDYRGAVETAYREGMVVGNDEAGTFNPKGLLTRAEGVTMLVRAGHTTAPKKTTDVASMLSNTEAYEAMKTMGKWEQVKDVNVPTRDQIRFTDAGHECIEVEHTRGDGIYIYLKEGFYPAYVEDGKVIVEDYGRPNVTGYSYEARRFVRSLLVKAYGEENAQAIYDGLRGIFESTAHVRGGGYPTEVLLVGDRTVYLYYDNDNKEAVIHIYKAGDTTSFDEWMADKDTNVALKMFIDFEHYSLIYDLDKW